MGISENKNAIHSLNRGILQCINALSFIKTNVDTFKTKLVFLRRMNIT